MSDIFIVNAAFLLSFWIRFHSGWIDVSKGTPLLTEYVHVLPFLTIVIVLLMNFYRLYTAKVRLAMIDEAFIISKVSSIGLFIFMAASFVHRDFSYSRGLLLVAWVVLTALLTLSRFMINRMRFAIRRRRHSLRNLLVIGTGEVARRLVNHVANDPHWDYRVCGLISTDSILPEDETSGIPILGRLDDIGRVFDENNIEAVILADRSLRRSSILDIVIECEKRLIDFKLMADLLGMVTSSVDMQDIDGFPLIGLKESPLNEWYNLAIKRAIDISGALLGLILFSPVFCAIAAAVKMDAAGPVFYLQERVGEDGRRFKMLKFRTMEGDAEKKDDIGWTRPEDPRRTKVGAFLRRFNLDELPQLANVIAGKMSLVGPRPERPHYVDEFKESIPRYMARHKIRSGMTGWAQVNGLRGDTSIEERTKYDLYYIESWSLLFDVKILLMSFLTIGKGY